MHWDGKSILLLFQNESTYNQSRDRPPLLDPDPGLLLFFCPPTALR
jgi:hypothetical protein